MEILFEYVIDIYDIYDIVNIIKDIYKYLYNLMFI